KHFQQPLERAKALREALRIVETIDADDQAALMQALLQAPHMPGADRLLRLMCDRIDIDADGEDRDGDPPAVDDDRSIAGIRAASPAHQIVAKALEIALRLESHQIVAAHGPHELRVARQDA